MTLPRVLRLLLLAFAGAWSMTAATSAGASDEDVRFVGQWPGFGTGGAFIPVAASGTTAYVGDSESGVHVIDIADPASPKRIGSLPVASGVWDVVLDGSTAHVATGAGLHIVDVTLPADPVLLGGVHLAGSELPLRLAVTEGFVHVAAGAGGLHIVDVRDPSAPRVVGTYDEVTVNGVDARDSFAYLAAGEGLEILDVADPVDPRRIGELAISGGVLDLRVEGAFAYVLGFQGLDVIDVSNPTNPRAVSRFASPGHGDGIEVIDGHVFLARETDGVLVLDVSDPANPTPVGTEPMESARSIAVTDGQVLVVDRNNGDWTLRSLDISDPTAPRQSGSYSHRGAVQDVVFAGTTAYLADAILGLLVLDIADPANPMQIGAFAFDGAGSGSRALALDGVTLYLGHGDGFHVIDVSDPANPLSELEVESGESPSAMVLTGGHLYVASEDGLAIFDPTNLSADGIPIGHFDTTGAAEDVAVDGTLAYVSDNRVGLWILDVADPAQPEVVARVETEERGRGLALAEDGKVVYLATDDGGLVVVDVADPNAPQIISVVDTSEANDVTIRGDRAYLSDASGLYVFDISDPARPRRVGRHMTESDLNATALAGDHAFLAIGDGGLRVVEVGAPAFPPRVGEADSNGFAAGVAATGHHAYLADDREGLLIFDVTDPAEPVPSGSVLTDEDVRWIATDERERLACAIVGNRVVVLDLANTANPVEQGSIAFQHGPVSLVMDGERCHVAGWAGGLHILDISDPQVPRRLGGDPGYSIEVALRGSHLFSAAGDAGLKVFDISDPANVVPVGGVFTGGHASSVALAGDHAFVRDEGLHVIDISDPTNPRRVGVYRPDGIARRILHVDGDRAIASAAGGIEVLDIRDPLAIRRLGGNSAFDASAAVRLGEHFLLSAWSDGIAILPAGPPTLRLHAPVVAADGTATLEIIGTPGLEVLLQRSSGLGEWEDWLPLTLGDAAVEVIDPDPRTTTMPARFYRAVAR